MSITLSALQKQRRDTAANWTAEDPTLLAGEIGLESDTGYWKVGDGATAWTSLAYVSGLGAEIPVDRLADGAARQLLQTDAAGTGVEWTDDIDVPGTLDVTGAATFDDDVTIQGDLTVNGTTTTIDTTTLVVEDKNIEIGKVATPTDVTADGGGITLKGSTDKTINWVDATDAWTLSEHVDIASGKEYQIAGTKVLDATSLGSAVVSSSLTSVGTIGTGVWNGTAIGTGYGGTGQTTYTDGELLIGKTDGTLAKATITQGSGVTITNGDGTITIAATGSGGTVTAVTGTSPIASTGGTTPDISIQDATTAQKGAVQLEDSTSSTSTTTAATPNSVKSAYDLANAALPKTGGTMTGDIVFSGTQTFPGTGSGTVTSVDVTGGTGLTSSGGPITSSGSITVDLDDTAVTPGSYTYASITVDQQGRLTAASNGTAPLTSSDIGVTVQGYDADTAKLDATQTFTAAQTFAADLTLNAQSDLRFADSDSSNWVAFQAPATVASNVTWTLPDADGTSGQVLSTNGTGTLSWATAAGGATDKIEEGNTSAEVIDTGSDGRFVVTTEGTEALRVDSSQRVGIGTTSPSSTLHLSAAQSELKIQSTSGTNPGYLTFIPATQTNGYYIYANSSRNLIFEDYATERMRIDSSGRLLVGTSSASGGTNAKALIAGNTNSAPGVIQIASTSASPASGDPLGVIRFSDSGHTQAAAINCERDGGTWTSGSSQPTRLVFSTTADGASSPTERMRVDNTGRTTLTGSTTTSGAFTFTTKNSASTTTFEVRNDGLINTGTAATSPYNFTTANAANFVVVSDGNCLRSTSSSKYKTNIETLQDQYADAILGCRPVWYQSTSTADNPDWGHWGFIAEEVAEIDPRLCFFGENEDGELEPDGVQYDRFVPHLLNLIKRQGEAITALQAEVAALKAS